MDSGLAASRRSGMTEQKVRAQPIGISAAPNMTGQARGEGERMAGRFDKAQLHSLFRYSLFRLVQHVTARRRHASF
jgi:hypothetical protein